MPRSQVRPALRHWLHYTPIRRAGVPAYVGPFDGITSVVAAYGARRLLSAYTGPLIRLRRSSDNAEQDFGYIANGDLDTAAIAAFVGAGSGFVVAWYDQSGNERNVTQSTAANQPLYVASGQNDRPVLRFDGVNDGLRASESLSLPSLTAYCAWQDSSNNRRLLDMRGVGAFGSIQGWFLKTRNDNSDVAGVDDGAGNHRNRREVTVATGVPHLSAMAYDASGDALTYRLDGTETGTLQSVGTIGSIVTDKLLSIGKEQGGSATQIFAGDMAEIIIANVAHGSSTLAAVEASINAYWSLYA